jgi:CSLREA domain-containing protein
MDFESGIDQAPIRSTIPGLEFSTTDGYDWIYGDWRVAGYNGPYPDGNYFSNGNFFAWLGVNQGLGRIDFVGSTASALSLGYSSFAAVALEACSNSLNTAGQLCSDGVGELVDHAVGAGNLDTGRLDRLSVQDPSMDYVLFHDSGNTWVIDDLIVVDLLADTSFLVPSNYYILEEKMITTDDGGSTIINFLVDSVQSNSVVVILNWGGSEFRVKVYDPNGDLVAVRQSNSPPITLTVPIGDVGNWSAEIVAVDVPYDGYPVSFIVASVAIGDLDGDGEVDRIDQSIFRSSLGKCTGDEGFIPETDYNADGCTDLADYRTWFGFLPPPPECLTNCEPTRSSFTPSITTTSLPSATVGEFYATNLSATGGKEPYSWFIVSGSLPPGLSLSSEGLISGTLTTAGTYGFTVQVTESSPRQKTTSTTLSIEVAVDPGILTVTKTADTSDGVCDGDCSLREAIIVANATPGMNTIIVPAGTYTLSIAGTGEDAAITGDLDITDDVDLVGAGAATTIIDGGGIDRVFDITGFTMPAVNISGVTIQNGNVSLSGGFGGGVSNGFATLSVVDSTIRNNNAALYGGVSNVGTMTLSGVTISGNTATGVGGGGGIGNGGTMALTNTTISGNTASGGSAIVNGPATGIALTNVTISDNNAFGGIGNSAITHVGGTFQILNTIIANNAGSNCLGLAIVSLGHNLEDANTCLLTGTGDLPNTNPLLLALHDYGGPTLTHALLAGSPAIDAGSNVDCPTTDQRGVVRPQGAACDIGAFELIAFDGDYSGSYIGTMDDTGEDVNGTIVLTIAQGLIQVAGPGNGTGAVFDNGMTSFFSGNPEEQFGFFGFFVVHGSGSFTGSGTWEAFFPNPDGPASRATGIWSVGILDEAASRADISGSWSGTWESKDGISGGSVSANFDQSDTSFIGSVTIGNSLCISNADVSGTVSGSGISFGVVSGASTITFAATVTLNSMDGTYRVLDSTVFGCAGDIGTFSLTR